MSLGQTQRQAVVLAFTPETRGQRSHTVAALWKRYLKQLLADWASVHARPADDQSP